MLARIYDSTMSGTLRYLDADIGDDGYIRRDWLNERLQEAVQGLRLPVQVGTVFATRTARLAQSGIKYIFHVAAVHGRVGRGYTPVDDQLDICVQRCFQKFAEIATRPDEPLESILFPLIGAGAARLSPQASAEIMLRQVRDSMESDCPQVKTVYLLAYVESHRQAIREAAEKVGLIEVKDAQT
jgi:O-acetyl-ADP-ribose deacetylase (regulator of RNase III)